MQRQSLFSALFLGHILNKLDLVGSLGRAVSGVFSLLQQTCLKGRIELDLVHGQEYFLNPPQLSSLVILKRL